MMIIPEFDERENRVHDLVVSVLAENNAKQNKGMPVRELISAVEQKFNNDLKGFRVYSLLRKADKSPNSKIRSGGPWRGYFLTDDSVSEENIPVATEETTVGTGSNQLKESDLYPLVAAWLSLAKEYKRVSYKHANRRGGAKWRNPDIIALNPIEMLGFYDVEIVTCEVKPSNDDWRRYIFEAVAHRMRSDRSYFIFRTKDKGSRIEPEYYEYAEKFRIGIAIIELPDDQLHKVRTFETLSDGEKAELIDAVWEIVPAPLEDISAKEKIDFLKQIEINSKEEIYMFGDARS